MSNGKLQIWIDGKTVINSKDLKFRNTDSVKIDSLFFSNFFGGDDASWSSTRNTYIDFDNFTIAKTRPKKKGKSIRVDKN